MLANKTNQRNLTMIRSFLFIALSFILISCSGDEEKKLEGDRITVLKVGANVLPDYSLDKLNVMLPYPSFNMGWYKSSGYHPETQPHPAAPSSYNDQVSVSAGRGNGVSLLSASPIVAEGKVFTIDGEGVLSAFDADNIKNKLWKYKIKLPKYKGDFANAGLTYYGGHIFVGTGFNQILSVDASSGEKLWDRTISSFTRSAPEVKDGRVFVLTLNNTLYALNAQDGSILWNHNGIVEEVGVAGAASPITHRNAVLVPYSSGELYALRIEDGRQFWSDSLALGTSNSAYTLSDIDASPIVVNNVVLAVSNSGVLAATEVSTGARVWEQDISTTKTPWYATGFLYLLTDKNELVAVHTKSGGVKWVEKLPNFVNEEKETDKISWNGPVLAGNRLLIVGSHGKMIMASPLTGKVTSTVKIPKDIYISPVVANNKVYLYTNEAKLIALSGPMAKEVAEESESE